MRERIRFLLKLNSWMDKYEYCHLCIALRYICYEYDPEFAKVLDDIINMTNNLISIEGYCD